MLYTWLPGDVIVLLLAPSGATQRWGSSQYSYWNVAFNYNQHNQRWIYFVGNSKFLQIPITSRVVCGTSAVNVITTLNLTSQNSEDFFFRKLVPFIRTRRKALYLIFLEVCHNCPTDMTSVQCPIFIGDQKQTDIWKPVPRPCQHWLVIVCAWLGCSK